jgi:hypothetical protein
MHIDRPSLTETDVILTSQYCVVHNAAVERGESSWFLTQADVVGQRVPVTSTSALLPFALNNGHSMRVRNCEPDRGSETPMSSLAMIKRFAASTGKVPKMSSVRTTIGVVTLPLLLLLQGCVSARLAQFSGFSQAGVAYVKASGTFIDEAGSAAIRGDSALLLKARPDLPQPERRERVSTANKLLTQRLLLLRQIKRHGQLLQDYFEVMGSMADSKAPESLGAAAQGVYDSLAKLSPTLKDAKIGGSTVSDFIPSVVPIVVAPLKAKTLENELRERGPLIERELALQEAMLTVLSQEIKTDLSIELNTQLTQDVINPYISAGEVPDDWAARREEILSATVASQSAGAAAQAANELRLGFQKLAANQFDSAALSSLIADINSILDLAEKIKPPNPGE